MQKLFNVMSVAAFAMSAGMVGLTAGVYSRIPSLTKHYMSELKLEIARTVGEMVPGKIKEAMPELPTETGPAIPGLQ